MDEMTRRIETNRRNARVSTGPKTARGKANSRKNATKHGILARALTIREGNDPEEAKEFVNLLRSLQEDQRPVGAVEELLVESLAVCLLRKARALRCESQLLRRPLQASLCGLENRVSDSDTYFESDVNRILALPLGAQLDRILRYETTIQRQVIYTLNQLERVQRMRRGEAIPAPLSVQVSDER